MHPITTIQPFIDLELYTVPLNGKSIHRNTKGKKEGYSFPSDWQKRYSDELNEVASVTGGLLTNHTTVVAIDCDDTETYNLFKSLDPTNTAYFDSIGKLDKEGQPLVAGTILYKGHTNIPASFRSTNGYDLDFYNGSGMVFLPTKANSTKTSWLMDEDDTLYNHNEQAVVIKDMPLAVISLLNLMKAKPIETGVANTTVAKRSRGTLGRVLSNMDLTNGDYIPQLTYILTPKEYRSELYKKQGHLHPNDINGSGHMYLFKIACAVASDSTVDKDMFIDLMDYLNELWDDPMPSKLLNKTIVAPIVTGKQTNSQGEAYWAYDEHWEEAGGFALTSKRDNELLDVFYDSAKKSYFVFYTQQEKLDEFAKRADLLNHLKDTATAFNKLDADGMKDVHTFNQPTRDYGFFNEDRDFNLFRAGESLQILHDPSRWKDNYKRPTEFVNYIEHFIPSEEQRSYFLSLLRTKLTTFGYSPVVPYIIGIQGSGKNTIMNVLKNIIGSQYVKTDIGGEQFLAQYNDYLMDTYFVQLNELGDTVTRASDKKKAQGLLKNYTGSNVFECRRMYRDPFTYNQTAMFILTANDSPLTIEDSDRRLYYIATPNTFDNSPQCVASSPEIIHRAIMSQTNDIAYYLATEVHNLQGRDYGRAPEAEGKQEMVFGSLNSSTKIAWALAGQEFDLLMEWLIDPHAIFNAEVTQNKVWLPMLEEAYGHHSSSDEPSTVMKLAMKAQGMQIQFGSYKGNTNTGYYIVPHISDYDGCSIPTDDEAEDIKLSIRN